MALNLDKLAIPEWQAALRSGEYEQGENVLCKVDDQGKKTFCCIGVKCDLLAKADPERYAWRQNGNIFRFVEYEESNGSKDIVSSSTDVFPSSVQEMFGLTESDIQVLTACNDGYHTQKRSFDEIATIIETPDEWERLKNDL